MQVYHGTRYIDEVVGLKVADLGRVYLHQDHNYNVAAMTDLTGRVLERYYYSPYGELEAVVDAHPFDYDDDGVVDDFDLAAATTGGDCWNDYDGQGGACKRLDANADREIDADDYNAIAAYVNSLPADGDLQRTPSSPRSLRGNPFAHQGLALDAEIGSYQNRARQYAPAKKRFMQRDPIGYIDGVNAYTYARTSPLLYRDPHGNISLIPELQLIVNIADSIRYGVGLGIEIATSLPIGTGYGAGFSHCFAHCLITKLVGEETSKEIGKDTEERQEELCLTLHAIPCFRDPWIFPLPKPCDTGQCRSAQQQTDYYDNQLGREVAAGDQPCFDGCKARMGNSVNHGEGPGTTRPYGPYGCPPGPRGNPDDAMPPGWGP